MAMAATSGIDPYADPFLAEPWEDLAALRELGPVVHLPQYDIWAVVRHDDVNAVLRDHETFGSNRGVGVTDLSAGDAWRKPSILVEADPPEHTVNRKVVAGTMTPKALRSLAEVFEEAAGRIVDELVEREVFDGVTDLAEIFPTEVFPRAFGIEVSPETRQRLLAYGSMVFNGNGPDNALFRSAMVDAADTVAWIGAQCAREALHPDGIGAAIHAAAAEAGLDEEAGGMLVRSFLSAGIDTTVSGIAFAVRNLAAHPDQWQALRSDPSLARNAFEETVRYECPVIGFYRTTTRDAEVDGVTIPSGRKVLALYAGANRDPARWDRPDEFDISRRVGGHLGYGVGIHLCVGMVIARMEGEAILGALADRVETLEVVGEVRPRLNNSLRGLDQLPLRVTAAR